MNGFKIYQNYKENKIHYKVFHERRDEDLILFVLSYPDDDIWGDNEYEDFSNDRMYYKRIYLHRDKWAEMKNYPAVLTAVNDFNNAIDEFKNVNDWHNFKNEVNVYLINEANKIIEELEKR